MIGLSHIMLGSNLSAMLKQQLNLERRAAVSVMYAKFLSDAD
jgi:hypothetical protein